MFFWKRLSVLTIVILFSIYLAPYISKVHAAGNFSLTVMHVNDSHSHVEKYPQLTTAVKSLREAYPQALLFHSGDVFYGTSYFTKFNGKADTWFMNYLKFDAMTLGNHEFDKGTTVLADFIKLLGFPVINSNLNMPNDSALNSLLINSISSSPSAGKIYPAIIKDVNGERIGIFGLLTNETKYNTLFQVSNPTEKAKATVASLKAQGINKIIVLSHLGYSADYSLAKAVDGIDIIVGGHSHTALKTPVLINKTEPTVIVQAGQYLDYLGLLNVTFNDSGVVIADDGKLLTLSTYTADPTVQAVLNQVNSGTLPNMGSQPEPLKNGLIVEADGNTYYYVNGVKQKGWQTVNGYKYYFGSDSGTMKIGWYTISGKRYYFDTATGVMKTGWLDLSGKRYYLGLDGVMVTGTITIDGASYTFDANGALVVTSGQTGLVKVGTKTYYYESGMMVTNDFRSISGNTYYFGLDGVMLKGWQTINGNKYYFGSDSGTMKTGYYTIAGVRYHFGSDGILIP